jgi:hypothetical protein
MPVVRNRSSNPARIAFAAGRLLVSTWARFKYSANETRSYKTCAGKNDVGFRGELPQHSNIRVGSDNRLYAKRFEHLGFGWVPDKNSDLEGIKLRVG